MWINTTYRHIMYIELIERRRCSVAFNNARKNNKVADLQMKSPVVKKKKKNVYLPK